MRVSSLSDPRVIELIRTYFVPSWVSRDFYQIDGNHDEERAEILRLDRQRRERGLEGGTVCVFLVAANGNVLATQRVQLAYKAENLRPLLEKIIAEQKLKPRSKEAIRASTAEPPSLKPKTKGGRWVHIWTRADTGANRGVSNDRVELTADEGKAFLPPTDAGRGATWTIPEKIAHKLFQYGYPPRPHWMVKDCKVLKGTLQATLLGLSDTEARLRLEGDLALSFPHGDPPKGRVTAHLVGVARVNLQQRTLTSLAMVSERANYVWYWKGKPAPIQMRIAMELEP